MAERALRYRTPEPSFYFHAGMIAASAGKTEEARSLLTHALDLNPQFDPDEAALARTTVASLPN
jgi:Tfp pilus assembly protein PilF